MLERVEAFEIISDKIRMRESFTADLVGRACDGTMRGYWTLERWIISQQYAVLIRTGVLMYESNMKPINRKI